MHIQVQNQAEYAQILFRCAGFHFMRDLVLVCGIPFNCAKLYFLKDSVLRDSIFLQDSILMCGIPYPGFHYMQDSVLVCRIQFWCAKFYFLKVSALVQGITFSEGFIFGVQYPIFLHDSILCRIQLFCDYISMCGIPFSA